MSSVVIYEDKENIQNAGFTSPPVRKLKNSFPVSSPKTPKTRTAKKDDSEHKYKERILQLEEQVASLQLAAEEAVTQERLASQPARVRKIMALSQQNSSLQDAIREKDAIIERLVEDNKALSFEIRQQQHEIEHYKIAAERASSKALLQNEPRRIRKIMQLAQEKSELEEQLNNIELTSQ